MKKITSSPLFYPFLIFCSAAFFRLFFLDLIEFKYDEAFTVYELIKFYSSPYLMQIGPIQSTGVYNFPLFNYIMILISLFSRDPQYLSFVIGLVNTIFILLFYVLFKRYYGHIVVFSSALVLSFSPWNILLSRKIWIPDLIVPFSILIIYFVHKVILDQKHHKKDFFYLFILLSLISQLHASGIFFSITTIAILIIKKVRLDNKNALRGFLVGTIPATPYFFRQISTGCIDCKSFLAYQNLDKPFDFNNFIRPFEIINGLGFNFILGNNFAELVDKLIFSPYLFFIFFSPFFALGSYYILKQQKDKSFLILYFVIFSVLFFLSKTPSYNQYFISISPIMALTFALSFAYLREINSTKILSSVLFSIFIIYLVIFNFTFFQVLKERKNIKGDYGPIYSVTKPFVEKITSPYIISPYYEELVAYSYMFSNPMIINGRIGYFFLEKNEIDLAIREFKQGLAVNDKDIFSRGYLTFVYIRAGNVSEAKKHLLILDNQDSTLSSKLRALIKE